MFTQPEVVPLDQVLIRLGWKVPDSGSDAERASRAIGAVMNALDVHRIGASYMMAIAVSWSNPDQAPKIANTVIDGYIFDQLNAKYQANRRASDWLQERLQTLREQTAAAERAVIEFKAKNKIVSVGGGALMSDKQLAEINGQVVAARTHVADIRARLEA